eukprot:161591-Rhodomonas_salina.1
MCGACLYVRPYTLVLCCSGLHLCPPQEPWEGLAFMVVTALSLERMRTSLDSMSTSLDTIGVSGADLKGLGVQIATFCRAYEYVQEGAVTSTVRDVP